MRYNINSNRAYTRKMKMRVFLRWFFYALALLLLYSLMSCGAFGTWQPYLIISLAIGVSMREYEFSSAVFGIFCGFMLDIAMNTLFGFFAVIMMPCCLLSSFLSRNLIKVNFVNHIIFTAATTLISFMMYYLFYFIVWNVSNREIIIFSVLLPSVIATVVTAPLMYFLSKFIARKLGLGGSMEIGEPAEEAADASEDTKNS